MIIFEFYFFDSKIFIVFEIYLCDPK